MTEPRISYCPLHEALYRTKGVDKKSVKRSVEMKIKGLGFCCEHI